MFLYVSLFGRKVASCIAGACLVLCGAFFVSATSPVAFKVQVNYYDFHEDGSNPEFEASATNGTQGLGLVEKHLDADKKPLKNPTAPIEYYVDHVGKWFRQWHEGDTTIYTFPGSMTLVPIDTTLTPFILEGDTLWTDTVITWDTTRTTGTILHSDTAFKNILITDSLIFQQVISTVQSTDTSYTLKAGNGSGNVFFPLDGRGFEALGFPRPAPNGTMNLHNYSFTMELHNIFIYQVGQTLSITGDDDIWVFINDSLVIDLGGIHAEQSGSVSLDSLGLTVGQSYSFDLFFAERHTVGSNLAIVTKFPLLQKTDYTEIPSYPVGIARKNQGVVSPNAVRLVLGHGITLSVPNATHTIALELIDVEGHVVARTNSFSVNNMPVDLLAGIPAGIYFVKAECRGSNGRIITEVVSSVSAVH